MIEIVYSQSDTKEGQVSINPPKNIRQMGSPRGRHKIYLEDYVNTFLNSAVFEDGSGERAALLLGRSLISQEIRYTFICGAVSCGDHIFNGGGLEFPEDCWNYFYREIKEYFPDQEIVGWYLGRPGQPMELTAGMEAAHRKYFVGREKVLLLMDPLEHDAAFYSFEQGMLQKKEGYYIYYEKNPAMQEYMVSIREQNRKKLGVAVLGDEKVAHSEWKPHLEQALQEDFADLENTIKHTVGLMEGQTDAEQESFLEQEKPREQKTISEKPKGGQTAEEAIQKYRSLMQETRGKRTQRPMSFLLYTAASAAMVVLCIIGITTMNNYEKMKEVQQVLAVLTDVSKEETDLLDPVEVSKNPTGGVLVQSVPGEVTPELDQPGTTTEGGEAGQTSSDHENDGTADSIRGETGEGGADWKTGNGTPPDDGTGNGTTTETNDGTDPGIETTANGGTEVGLEIGTESEVSTSAQTYLEQGYYVVQPGDKLELICKKIYQTTTMMDQLCQANQITDVNKIYAGQKLILP